MTTASHVGSKTIDYSKSIIQLQFDTPIRSDNYESLLTLLRQEHAQKALAGDTARASLLLATIQICMACIEARDEWQWRHNALSKAQQRHDELAQVLGVILHQVDVYAASATFSDTDNLVEPDDPEPSAHYQLWRRFHTLLHPYADSIAGDAVIRSIADTPLMPAAPPAVHPLNTHQPVLAAYFLGPFEVSIDHQMIGDIGSRKGKQLLKYLLVNREQRIPKEVLMELFWPDTEPPAARNNLNVAIHSLRRALRTNDSDFSHILFEDDCYFFNPDMLIWVDYEKFVEQVERGDQQQRAGQHDEAIQHYRVAETLYRGELLAEDIYEDWLTRLRLHLQTTYLRVLEHLSRGYYEQGDFTACIHICQKMIQIDPCREDAHAWLMRCYSQQGQHYLALRQYHLCADSLEKELDTAPSPQIHQLYEQIRSTTYL